MKKRCAPGTSRFLPIPPPTCWTRPTSGPLRPCCGCWTTRRRMCRWRRCCSARCSPAGRTIWWPCATPCPPRQPVRGGALRRAAALCALYRGAGRIPPSGPYPCRWTRLLEELLARTGYLAAVGALPDGMRCREDLLTFVNWASNAGRGGLSALVRAMDSAAANGGLAQSGGGQTRPGCVSIMTVERCVSHRVRGRHGPTSSTRATPSARC